MSGNHLIILNRWGNIVFESHGYSNTFDGANVNEGVYWYLFRRDPKNDPENVVHGFLHVFIK